LIADKTNIEEAEEENNDPLYIDMNHPFDFTNTPMFHIIILKTLIIMVMVIYGWIKDKKEHKENYFLLRALA
jgi:hypothetical protein